VSITTIVSTTAQLLATLAGAQPGDVIKLAPGTYSNVSISGKNVSQVQATPGAPTRVFIESQDSNKPAVLTDLNVSVSTGLYFQDLTFSTATAPVSQYGPDATVPFKIYSSSQLTFTGIAVLGSSSENYTDDATGLLIENSNHVTIRSSTFNYLHNGLDQVNNSWMTVSANTFTNIDDDGIRGGGTSNITITGNSFASQHADATDQDHPDAIQFWTSNTTTSASNISITDNIMTRGNGNAVQGIFISDQVGDLPYKNILIQGNTLTGELWNGIYVEDTLSTQILDNTLISYPDYNSAIKVLDSSGTTVMGNSAGSYDYIGDTGLKSSSNTISETLPLPVSASSHSLGVQASFTALSSAVPEPSIWSMMLVGAGVCGAFLRNRRLAT
jgi:hypothetical protein